MRKVLALAGMLLLLAIPPQLDAKEICFYRRVVDKGKSRTVLPQVTGDLETNVLTLGIYRYTGVARICVFDNTGNIVQTYSKVIQGKNTIDLDLGELTEGEYTVTVTLDDIAYFGIVSLY